MANAPGPTGDALNMLAFTHTLGGEWILIDGDTDGHEFAADASASEETMIATLRRMIANLETKFRAERILDVMEAADELVVLCDALDKAEEDEEDRLQGADEERHADGFTTAASSDTRTNAPALGEHHIDYAAEHRDYEDIDGRIVMRRRRSAAALRRGLLGESDTIIKGLVWLLFNGDCQVNNPATILSSQQSLPPRDPALNGRRRSSRRAWRWHRSVRTMSKTLPASAMPPTACSRRCSTSSGPSRPPLRRPATAVTLLRPARMPEP